MAKKRKMVSQRAAWKGAPFFCLPYICTTCGRDKGMIYLFPDRTLRYVCFCGANISTAWIQERYDFLEKKYQPEKVEKNFKTEPFCGNEAKR